MIGSFRRKGLKRYFEDADRSKLRPGQVRRIGLLLAALESAKIVEELDIPGFGLHPLKGEFKGFWSVSVNGKLAHHLSF